MAATALREYSRASAVYFDGGARDRKKRVMSDVSKTVETLLAHARRCRELAASTQDKRIAEELERLAEASVRAAEEIRARK